jgi:flagellar hook-associated protein 3 FlgL
MPSDDPIGAGSVIGLNLNLEALAQQKKGCEFSQGWLKAGESAMASAQSVISRARELAVQMSSATYSAQQRQSAAREVDALLEQMVSLGNTRYQGRYIFAGYQDGAAPFETTEVGGDITAVTYVGDSGSLGVKIGPGNELEVGSPGSQVFQGSSDVFASLVNLRNALENNDPDATAGEISALTNAGNNLGAEAAVTGARLGRVELRLSVIADTKLSDTDRLSTIQDTDLVEAVAALQSKQVLYQAALQSASAIGQMNLSDYL